MASTSTGNDFLEFLFHLNSRYLLVAPGKLSREEFRRQKELDAARKAGTAPAALDEEGKPINPHIPRKSTTYSIHISKRSQILPPRIYLTSAVVC